MRRIYFAVPLLVLLSGILTACSSAPQVSVWQDDVEPAVRSGSVGGSSTACTLPVTFDIAPSWTPRPVVGAADSLPKQGNVTLACEIDAKPAGVFGFLRVWSSIDTVKNSRRVLDAYLAEEREISEPKYRETMAGPFSATEVTYLKSSTDGPAKRERALSVLLPEGYLIIHIGGLDTQEHEKLLPGYELARDTMAASAASFPKAQ
ncbi:lipoprotein [Streptomyces sp. NPDC006682]|uniref:lipoprotein n=1 Tax=Streptomyces TaxID=1883 RepID=UPI00331A1124